MEKTTDKSEHVTDGIVDCGEATKGRPIVQTEAKGKKMSEDSKGEESTNEYFPQNSLFGPSVFLEAKKDRLNTKLFRVYDTSIQFKISYMTATLIQRLKAKYLRTSAQYYDFHVNLEGQSTNDQYLHWDKGMETLAHQKALFLNLLSMDNQNRYSQHKSNITKIIE